MTRRFIRMTRIFIEKLARYCYKFLLPITVIWAVTAIHNDHSSSHSAPATRPGIRPDDAVNKVMNWLKAKDFVSTKVQAFNSRSDPSAYGLVASAAIAKNERILSVPPNLLLRKDACSISKLLRRADEPRSMIGEGNLHACLISEYGNITVRWRPYFEHVAGERDANQSMFWEMDELESHFGGAGCVGCLFTRVHDYNVTSVNTTRDAFLEMHRYVTSREFEPTFKRALPIPSLATHSSSSSNARLRLELRIGNESSGADPTEIGGNRSAAVASVVMCAAEDIAPGEELRVGARYNRSYDRELVWRHGFVRERENSFDVAEVPIRYVYEAARKTGAQCVEEKIAAMEREFFAAGDFFHVTLRGIHNVGGEGRGGSSDFRLIVAILSLSDERGCGYFASLSGMEVYHVLASTGKLPNVDKGRVVKDEVLSDLSRTELELLRLAVEKRVDGYPEIVISKADGFSVANRKRVERTLIHAQKTLLRQLSFLLKSYL